MAYQVYVHFSLRAKYCCGNLERRYFQSFCIKFTDYILIYLKRDIGQVPEFLMNRKRRVLLGMF